LFVGTYKDNMQDALAKGRCLVGSRNGNAKLGMAEIAMILANPKPQWKIADLLGVAQTTVSRVLRGVRYRKEIEQCHIV